MIYFSNSSLSEAHMTFIGRWSPFHKGHTAVITKKIQEKPDVPILILIRNTNTDQYSPIHRAMYIKTWMVSHRIKGTIMIIPNVEGVYWGRGVGYVTELVEIDKQIQQISGTNIRNQMKKSDRSWNALVANNNTSYMLTTTTTRIIEHGLVVWLTGCPSSGKSTIAAKCIEEIHTIYPHIKTQLLDGDIMRSSPLAANAGFSTKNRSDHIHRMAYIAGMFANHGIVVLCTFVSPTRLMRSDAKKTVGKDRFIEIYIKASKKNRISRDPKGLYKQAKEGKITNLTGYNSVYQSPVEPDVICNTNIDSAEMCAADIIHHIFHES